MSSRAIRLLLVVNKSWKFSAFSLMIFNKPTAKLKNLQKKEKGFQTHSLGEPVENLQAFGLFSEAFGLLE
jgi:hypothetical protein